jgi:hypothetical protein
MLSLISIILGASDNFTHQPKKELSVEKNFHYGRNYLNSLGFYEVASNTDTSSNLSEGFHVVMC